METCCLCLDKVPKTDTLRGSAWGITGTICKECIDYVGNDSFQESLTPTMSNLYTPTYDIDWAYYSDTWDVPVGKYNGAAIYTPCHHHMVPFTFEGLDNTHTVYLSGSSALKHDPGSSNLPTVGVYMDESWFVNRLASNTSSELDMAQPASLYIGWLDFGTIKPELLSEAVDWLIPHLYNKSNIVEIACMGGHGRTGTYLASLMVREGWAPADAMEYIHGGYCKKAIETKAQEDLIESYSRMLIGATYEVTS